MSWRIASMEMISNTQSTAPVQFKVTRENQLALDWSTTLLKWQTKIKVTRWALEQARSSKIRYPRREVYSHSMLLLIPSKLMEALDSRDVRRPSKNKNASVKQSEISKMQTGNKWNIVVMQFEANYSHLTARWDSVKCKMQAVRRLFSGRAD